MSLTSSLIQVITSRCQPSEDQSSALSALSEALKKRYGTMLQAIILYGSYRRGDHDALIDLYVFVEDEGAHYHPAWQVMLGRLLPPNVYYLQLPDGVRAKYALMSLARFENCVARDFHSYFWGRFAQPCLWLWQSDGSFQQLASIQAQAVRRFIDEAVSVCDDPVDARTLWLTGLQCSYRAELRAESAGRAEELVNKELDYYQQLTSALAREKNWAEGDPGCWIKMQNTPKGNRRWRRRQLWGKCLSVFRLLKAASTYRGGFEYLLWKIHRHSGIYLEPTPRQRRYPLIFAWPLFWKLYRLGAFR